MITSEQQTNRRKQFLDDLKFCSKLYIKVRRKEKSKTLEGRIACKKRNSYRRNKMGFNPVNNWFPESNAHHINKIDVIYIPTSLHIRKGMRHNYKKLESMININRAAFQYLTDTIKQL